MMAALFVSVLIDGKQIEGSVPAQLRHGLVVAPLSPYIDVMADALRIEDGGRRILLERGGRTVFIPIAPYLRADEAKFPLASVARALGGWASYDARTRTLTVQLPAPAPLALPAPYIGPLLPAPQPSTSPGPIATLAPAPGPTVVPRPRRTPIVVEDPEP
jgi:hypothetical protein